jgi:hypothetical protein
MKEYCLIAKLAWRTAGTCGTRHTNEYLCTGLNVLVKLHAAEHTRLCGVYGLATYVCCLSALLRPLQALCTTIPVSNNSYDMAPIHDALSVPEILETIILNLPLRHIIRSRAVCREFRRIIDDTTSIQRALFLQPTSIESLVWFRRCYSNPLYHLLPVIEPDQAPRG